MKFPPEITPCACCWSVGNHVHFQELATIKFSLMETFFSMEVELTWMGLWNGAVEGQLLSVKQRGISVGWRSGQKTVDMWANCVLKHCLSLKTFIPNFVAFFVSLGIVLYCKFAIMQDVVLGHFGKTGVYAGRPLFQYPPPKCPLVRDSEPIRLLVIPTSPSLYMLINIIFSLPFPLSSPPFPLHSRPFFSLRFFLPIFKKVSLPAGYG